jgi:hypothetical protein
MSSNPEEVTVSPNKIEPLYIYLGVLCVAGLYAASNHIQAFWYHWVESDDNGDKIDPDERAAQVARSRSNMQNRLDQSNKSRKKRQSNQNTEEQQQEPLKPRVVSLRNRGNRCSSNGISSRDSDNTNITTSSSNSSSSSSTSMRQSRPTFIRNQRSTSHDDDKNVQINLQTEHDALYAASLQVSEEAHPFSSSTVSSSSSISNLTPSELRARQDGEYEASLRQDQEKRRLAETKQDEEMQIAIQQSILDAKEKETINREKKELELLKVQIPMEPLDDHTIKKIQFRFSSGKTIKRNFMITNTIGEIISYVKYEYYLMENIIIQCTLSTAYPRRQFTKDDSSKTLEECELFKNGAKSISMMVQDVDA